ncbi:MAG: valine dehydrogenase [Actinobacteria bacterium]|nr:valine dehydrogenase [Actinomycetota bacterium]
MEGPFARFEGHEQVVFGNDPATGLRCIIAIHSTALGPGLGGTRFYPYADEEDALVDVLRLSRGMSYKAACAGLDLGGGKGVIIGDPAEIKTEALLRAYGRVVESLNGRYITACDVGTYPNDLEIVGRETAWATGADVEHGGSGDSGILTAFGVFVGMKATAQRLWGQPTLAGRHVAVQGLGKVGRRLVEHLLEDGAKVTAADIDEEAVARVGELDGVDTVAADEIVEVDADVLSPNALGAVLTEDTIPRLQVAAVCGGANNQLGTVEDAARLQERGILYAPDYVVNAGGLINVSDELHPDGYDPVRCQHKAQRIGSTLLEIFAEADEQGVTTEIAAERVAEKRMASVGRLRGFWLP